MLTKTIAQQFGRQPLASRYWITLPPGIRYRERGREYTYYPPISPTLRKVYTIIEGVIAFIDHYGVVRVGPYSALREAVLENYGYQTADFPLPLGVGKKLASPLLDFRWQLLKRCCGLSAGV